MLSLNSCDFEQHENTNCYEFVVEGKYPVESKLVTSLDQSPSKFDIWAMACCPVIKVMRKSNKCQTKITQEQPTSRQRDNPKLCQSLSICCKRKKSHKKIQDDEAEPRLPSSLFCSCRWLDRPIFRINVRILKSVSFFRNPGPECRDDPCQGGLHRL